MNVTSVIKSIPSKVFTVLSKSKYGHLVHLIKIWTPRTSSGPKLIVDALRAVTFMNVEILFNNLFLNKLTGTREWVVTRDFTFYVDGTKYTVPKGFKTNLASTPRVLWPLFPPSGIYTEASVAHDWLYHTEVIPFNKADKVYQEICELCGTSKVRSKSMYLGLRSFGWLHRALTKDKKK